MQKSLIWQRWLPSVITLLLFFLAIFALHHVLLEISYRQLMLKLSHLPMRHLLLAVLATGVSFVALSGYDWTALTYLGKRLSYGRVALGSFCGYAIGNTLGFSLLSGASVRYRIYAGAGLDGADVARVTAFCALSFGVGVHVLGAVALCLHPELLAKLTHIPILWLRVLGAMILVLVAVTFLWSWLRRNAALKIWRCNIPLPSPRLMTAQLGFACVDILAASVCLYFLLPVGAPPFLSFLLIFALASVAGVISHVPGGLGVFESVILLGLKEGHLPVAGITAALLAYRAIYYLLPLLMATLLLTAVELTERMSGKWSRFAELGRWSGRLVPSLTGGFAVISGLVMLLSSATPAVPGRLEMLQDLLPLAVVEVSHVLAALVGLALLILARGLVDRLNGAYFMTLLYCAAGIILSLAKGFDWEEAAVLLLLTAILLLSRKQFYRSTALLDEPYTIGWLSALLASVGGMVWVTLFAFKHTEYSHLLWWQFEYDAAAPRAMRAGVAVAMVASAFALRVLLRPPRFSMDLPDAGQLEKVEQIVQSHDYTVAQLALMGDKCLLFHPSGSGFVMFGVQGRSWIALGDPVGPEDIVEDLAWSFRELVDRENGRIAFYQVRPQHLPIYLDMNLSPVKIGEEALVLLDEFSLEGSAGKEFRYILKRAEREGLQCEIHPCGDFVAYQEKLNAISDQWLEGKQTQEKRFSMGAFLPSYLSRSGFALIRRNGAAVAFASLMETQVQGEASVDLMRHGPDAPSTTMEFLFVSLLEHFRREGYRSFTLGMAPFSGLETHPLAPVWQRFGAMLYNRGEPYYNFQGLRRFKDKFHPQWEPRYLVTRGGIDPAWVLADAAVLIAGGMRGVFAK